MSSAAAVIDAFTKSLNMKILHNNTVTCVSIRSFCFFTIKSPVFSLNTFWIYYAKNVNLFCSDVTFTTSITSWFFV